MVTTRSRESRPCLTALRAERRLPSGDLGPVDFWAFRRLARCFLGETGFSAMGSFFMGHLRYITSEGLAGLGAGVERENDGNYELLITNYENGRHPRR